eukprot:gene5212-5450_t
MGHMGSHTFQIRQAFASGLLVYLCMFAFQCKGSLESAAKASARDWGRVSLVPSSRGASIPTTYLGISHEWTNVEELNHGGTYQRLLEDLTAYGGGPLVLRVGGGSTDKQYQPPSQTVFDSLKTLHDETGMLFIFGINWKHRDITLARNQMEAIKAKMPTGSVLSIELGNEPNFYDWVDGKPNRDWMSCCFVNDWAAFARQLSCPGNFSTCVHHQLAGPAWGHVNMRPRTMDWYLKFNNFWLNLVTVHWYQATRETSSTVENLLDEEPLRAEMKNLRQLVEISSRSGISNSLAAALWTLDGAFEVASTGAVGINLHWGDGLSLYAALLRQSSGSSIVKPPYYAYLMFQMALGQGVSFIANPVVEAGSNPLVKVWPLVDNKSGAVRVVLINKHKSKPAGVAIRLVAAAGEQYADGKVIRMLGKKGLADQWGVSLGGMTYKIGGAVKGAPAGEVVKGQTVSETTDRRRSGTVWKYPVRLPAGSAALVVIPRK